MDNHGFANLNKTALTKYAFIPEFNDYVNSLNFDKSEHTIRSYIVSINRFFDYADVRSINDIKSITPSVIRDYQIFLKNNGLKASSINSFMRPLKVFYNWLLNDEKIEFNPFTKVKSAKEPKNDLAFLSEEEIEIMFNGCKGIKEKTMLAFFIALGLRRSELVNLKVSDIADHQVNVMGKGSKYRALFLPDDVYDLLQEYLSVRNEDGSGFLFLSTHGGKYTLDTIRRKIQAIARRAGIEEDRIQKITPHALRRTFATNLVEQDVNMRVIQGALGHADISTTMKYAKLRNSAVEYAMKNQRPIIK